MRRLLLTILLAGLAADVLAMRNVGFNFEAFRDVAQRQSGSFAFSPASFELDMVAFALTQDTLAKAEMTERLGATTGLANVYDPIFTALRGDVTNGCSAVSARGFCVPKVASVLPLLRHELADGYGIVVAPLFPPQGAEAWFRAETDGLMENFKVVLDRSDRSKYAFYDLECVRFAWREPFPTANTRKMTFTRAIGEKSERPFFCDARRALTYETESYTMLELPLAGESRLFAFQPKEGHDFSVVWRDLSPGRVEDILLLSKALIDRRGVRTGPTLIALPVIETASKIDLLPLMTKFRFPYSGIRAIAGGADPREIAQFVRFRLDERGNGRELVRKRPEDEVRATPDMPKALFNRPFAYFIIRDDLPCVPVAGVYDGN